jgi:DNA-binding response OmpR family regulator
VKSGRRNIVLVEDDRNQRKLYEHELREAGYAVRAFADASEALFEVEKASPDLVILDISMPGMNGLEALGKILGVENTTPVIFNTAYPRFRDNFLSWAADAYVVKSADLTELKETVAHVLAESQISSAESSARGSEK